MADLFAIDDDIKQLYMDGMDTMINQLGRACRFVLEGVKRQCPNCRFDSANGKSAGIYNGTGPRAFTRPPCPVCRGTGFDPTSYERNVDVKLLIEWNAKPYNLVIPQTIVVPQGIVRTKGLMKDLPTIQQCKYVIIDHANATYMDNKFVLLGEPTPQGSIVPGRYFEAYWRRMGT